MIDPSFIYRIIHPSETPELAVERMKAARQGPHFRALFPFLTFDVWEYGEGPFLDPHPNLLEIRKDMVSALRRNGWLTGKDKGSIVWRNRRYFKSLGVPVLAARGRIRVSVDVRGRRLDASIWPDHNNDHNNPRYSFRRWEVMGDYDRRLVTQAFLALRGPPADRGLLDATEPEFCDPYDILEYRYRNSTHKKWTGSLYDSYDSGCRNDVDYDNKQMVNGDIRYFYDGFTGGSGYIARGEVFHNINNMWWVVSGGNVRNMPSHALFSPSSCYLPRRFVSSSRVRAHLDRAVSDQNFELAIHLRDQIKSMTTFL